MDRRWEHATAKVADAGADAPTAPASPLGAQLIELAGPERVRWTAAAPIRVFASLGPKNEKKEKNDEKKEKKDEKEEKKPESKIDREKCYQTYLAQTAYCGSNYTDDRLYEICMANAWKNYIRCLNGLSPTPLVPR